MTTRHITTSHETDVCDICGRTLLRGESTEVFLEGSRRYAVCELCKHHALHEGWVREGTIPEYQGSAGGSRQRRSLLGRLRGIGAVPGSGSLDGEDGERSVPRTLDDELSVGQWPPVEPRSAPEAVNGVDDGSEPMPGSRSRSRSVRSGRTRGARRDRAGIDEGSLANPLPDPRDTRHVHAVPTSGDHKVAAAVDVFNRSEHTRTVSGVARSLGPATVNLTPDPARPTVVWLVVSWELCWYRYEIELSDDPGSVRLDSQGYELAELADHELSGNAVADEAGRLAS